MLDDYAAWQIAAILATYLLAASAKGVTGLGFSTTCLPFLAITVGLKSALPLLIIPSLAANFMVMRQAGHFRETVHRFWPMLAATVPGLMIGLSVLAVVEGRRASGVLGVILILWCVFAISAPNFRLPDARERVLGVASGAITGVTNGLTGSQVMPCVPYLMALRLDRQVFIQATNCSFTLSSFIMAMGLVRLDLFTLDAVILSSAGAVVAYYGLRIGQRIQSRLSPDRFRLAVLVMLIVMGSSLVVRAL